MKISRFWKISKIMKMMLSSL
nr:unnamed protein product [Callosobruchus analis]